MAVRSFLHYALEVPDQAVGQRYYEDFGLVDVTGGNKAVRLKPARQDREAVYYIRDPWGGFAEYYFDLDCIPEDCAWQPRDFPGEDSLYIWGPPVPDDFGENKEVA